MQGPDTMPPVSGPVRVTPEIPNRKDNHPMKRLIAGLAMVAASLGTAVVAASPAEAARPHPDYVCGYFKPHTGDAITVAHSWYYEPGVVEIYRCAYAHPGSGSLFDHPKRVYRYSDGSWSQQPGW